MRQLLILVALLALAGCGTYQECTSCSSTELAGGPKVTSSAWKDRVAVYSNNSAIQAKAPGMVKREFGLRRTVPVPDSYFLVRIHSCSSKRVIKLCLNVQYDGRILARKEFRTSLKEGCADTQSRKILEDMLFEDSRKPFLNFVRRAMNDVG